MRWQLAIKTSNKQLYNVDGHIYINHEVKCVEMRFNKDLVLDPLPDYIAQTGNLKWGKLIPLLQDGNYTVIYQVDICLQYAQK